MRFDKVRIYIMKKETCPRCQFHGTNGQDSMRRIIESKQGDFDKWPVALVHSISMKFVFDALGQLQASVEKLKNPESKDAKETKSE